MKKFLYIFILFSVSLYGQHPTSLVGGMYSTDGSGDSGTWAYGIGSGGSVAPFSPSTLAGLMYSTDGTGNAGTWAYCTSACFGGGGGGTYLPLAGGTMTGPIAFSPGSVGAATNTNLGGGYYLWPNDESNRSQLVAWNGLAANILQNSGSINTVVLGLVGDSWWQNGNISTPLTTQLQNRFGNGGIGYKGFFYAGTGFSGGSITSTGTWTGTTHASPSYGPDNSDYSTSDVATPATLTGVCSLATKMQVFYLLKPGGGGFNYTIDGGASTPITTANASIALGTLTFSGLTLGSHTFAFTTTSAGSTGITMLGQNCLRTDISGAVIQNLGSSGSTAGQWTGIPAALWESELTALGINTFILQFGAVEKQANTVPATMTANFATLASEMVTALPNADISVSTEGDNNATGTYTMAQYAQAASAFAQANNYSLFNNYLNFPNITQSNALGLYIVASPELHLNATGGLMTANYLYQWLNRQLPTPSRQTQVLAQDATGHSITGTVAQTSLFSYTLPAYTMGRNGSVRITSLWTVTNSANNKLLQITFGGTNYTNSFATTSASVRMETLISNRGVTNSQVGGANTFNSFGATASATNTSSIDTTANQTIVLYGTLSNTGETIKLESVQIELLPGIVQ